MENNENQEVSQKDRESDIGLPKAIFKNVISRISDSLEEDRGRARSVMPLMEVVAALLSLIATILAGVSTNIISDILVPKIPTSVIVAFSITLGIIIILYAAWSLYRKQAKTRQLAINKLQEEEKTFFANVENEIVALLAEEVL